MADAPAGFKEIAPPPGFKEVAPKAPVERGEGDKVDQPTTPESIQKGVLNPGQPQPLDPIQKAGNIVAPIALTAPTIAAGGMALPAAPIIGEALAAGALGGAKSASRGESPLWGAFVDSLTSAGWGGAMKIAPNLLKIPFSGKPSLGDLQGRKGAYESVAPRIEQAFNAIKGRLPDTKWVRVPTLGTKKMTPKEAIEGLKKLEGTDFKQARQEIVAEFEKKVTHAGTAMDLRAPADRFAPTGTMQRIAEGAVPPLKGQGGELWPKVGGQSLVPNAERAAVEAAATQDVGGIPVGAIPPLKVASGVKGFGDIARTIFRLGH